jgi:high-affinity Fe2+/Pb2+ permease
MNTTFTSNESFRIILSVGVDNEMLLVIEFVNLEIKLTQSFRDVHKSRMRVYVFIGVSTHMYIRIYIYIIFLTKKKELPA